MSNAEAPITTDDGEPPSLRPRSWENKESFLKPDYGYSTYLAMLALQQTAEDYARDRNAEQAAMARRVQAEYEYDHPLVIEKTPTGPQRVIRMLARVGQRG